MSEKRFQLLSEAQWELIEPLLPEPKLRKDKRGQASSRACLDGILWVLRRGVAIFARQVNFACDLLAAVEAVGRAGCVA
jgi:transposase